MFGPAGGLFPQPDAHATKVRTASKPTNFGRMETSANQERRPGELNSPGPEKHLVQN
jgi:hypothetical protein